MEYKEHTFIYLDSGKIEKRYLVPDHLPALVKETFGSPLYEKISYPPYFLEGSSMHKASMNVGKTITHTLFTDCEGLPVTIDIKCLK